VSVAHRGQGLFVLQRLEVEFDTELESSRVTNSRYRTKGRRCSTRLETREICCVEDIERLGTQLQAHAFGKSEILHQRKVKPRGRRPKDRTPAAASRYRSNARTRSGSVKCASVKVPIYCMRRIVIWVTDLVRPSTGRGRSEKAKTCRIITAKRHRKRNAGLIRKDAGCLPSAQ